MLRRVRDALTAPFEWRFGPLEARREHRRVLASVPRIGQALQAIDARWPERGSPPDDRPVFILSAGWRSGSTLLQRLILSGEDALIWGEPYDHCDLVRRLADSLRAFGPEYPPDHFVHGGERIDSGVLAGDWVANLYPHPSHLRAAHRAFLQALYGEPASVAGFRRWGFKEVRLGMDYARYLSWLFPAARFVLLHRNPYDAYRSYRRFRGWYDRWPTEPVLTPRQFGVRWRDLVAGFVGQHDVPGTLLLRYEDLIRDASVVEMLSEHIGMSLRGEVLTERIAGAGKGKVRPQSASAPEIRALGREVQPLASRLGYEP